MLSPGTRLGPYEILSSLGAGGMGEVYKGRDTRLDRLVALKLLAPHLAANREARERFEREATTVAKLKHAHICLLYDIGTQELPEVEEAQEAKEAEVQVPRRFAPRDDRPELVEEKSRDREGAVVSRPRTVRVDYLVFEYLEGETLSQRLAKGPLPLDQVLQYSIEIADALDKAHRAGVTHRDIKPGNIMIVPSSETASKTETKLLDFGLAKLKHEVEKATIPASERPTIPGGALTQGGTILGTLHYMAPEQLESKEVDGRADIFSFGAVVHEMATGKKAFPGETQASIIAKILDHNPPPVSSLEPPGKLSPPALDRVVERCLAKDREDRWQAMRDVCHELKWVKGGGAEGRSLTVAAQTGRAKLRERVLVAVAAVAIVIAAIAVSISQFGGGTAQERMAWLSVLPPENTTFLPSSVPALSPDGRRLAFVALSSGRTQLWIRPLDSAQAQPLVGTEGAYNPFWSPDSRFLGFFADGKLKRIEVSGGPPLTLADAVQGIGGTWNRDGVIVFSPANNRGLMSVPAAGGTAAPLTTLDPSRGETSHRWPNFLPDGRHFLYIGFPTGVYVGSLDSKETRQILSDQSKAVYAPPGFLFFVRQGTLMVQPFDAQRLEFSGEAFPIVEGIAFGPAFLGGWAFSVSEGGVLSYRSGADENLQLAWFDRTGKQLDRVGPPGNYISPRLSPDGTRLAVEKDDDNNLDIWLVDLNRGIQTRFTFNEGTDRYPTWSPDGNRIVFRRGPRGSSLDIYQKLSSGAGNEELLLQSGIIKNPYDWSPDGSFIVYSQADPKGNLHPWVLPTFGDPSAGSPQPSSGQAGQDRKPFQLLQGEFQEAEYQVSPDGRWMAYSSNESGRYEVYIQSFPMPAGKWQVSNGGGMQPRWRRDGRELFYVAPDRRLMAIPIRADSTVAIGTPVALFETPANMEVTRGFRQQYDVTADGQRFLMIVEAEGASAASPFTVVLNWTAGLKR